MVYIVDLPAERGRVRAEVAPPEDVRVLARREAVPHAALDDVLGEDLDGGVARKRRGRAGGAVAHAVVPAEGQVAVRPGHGDEPGALLLRVRLGDALDGRAVDGLDRTRAGGGHLGDVHVVKGGGAR